MRKIKMFFYKSDGKSFLNVANFSLKCPKKNFKNVKILKMLKMIH